MTYLGGQIFNVVLVILGLVLSFGGGYYVNRNIADSNLRNTNTDLTESLEKIKKSLPEIKEVRSFEGTVKSIGNNSITIEVAPSFNSLIEWPVVREVVITSETKILHRGVKSPDTLQEEFRENKKVLSAFFQDEISINDIRPGWTITVEATEDIRTKTSFEASRVLNDWPFLGSSLDLLVTDPASVIDSPATTPVTNNALPPIGLPKPPTPEEVLPSKLLVPPVGVTPPPGASAPGIPSVPPPLGSALPTPPPVGTPPQVLPTPPL